MQLLQRSLSHSVSVAVLTHAASTLVQQLYLVAQRVRKLRSPLYQSLRAIYPDCTVFEKSLFSANEDKEDEELIF